MSNPVTELTWTYQLKEKLVELFEEEVADIVANESSCTVVLKAKLHTRWVEEVVEEGQ